MPNPTVAIMGGSSLLSFVGARKSAKEQQRGIESGISAEERMSERNLEFQRELEEQQREDFAPWRDIGEQALNQIWEGVQAGEFEVGQINLEDDPGYQFRLKQGIEARDASASARGRLQSGAQDKAITRYGQELGSQEYGNVYARELQKKQQKFNILSGLSTGGRAAAARQAGATSQLAQTGGNIMSNTGRALNIGRTNIGGVRAGAYGDYATITNQAAQNWLTYKAANAA